MKPLKSLSTPKTKTKSNQISEISISSSHNITQSNESDQSILHSSNHSLSPNTRSLPITSNSNCFNHVLLSNEPGHEIDVFDYNMPNYNCKCLSILSLYVWYTFMDWKWQFSISRYHTHNRNIDVFYLQHTDQSSDAIMILKIDLDLLWNLFRLTFTHFNGFALSPIIIQCVNSNVLTLF